MKVRFWSQTSGAGAPDSVQRWLQVARPPKQGSRQVKEIKKKKKRKRNIKFSKRKRRQRGKSITIRWERDGSHWAFIPVRHFLWPQLCESGRKDLFAAHTRTAACLSHQQQLGTITTPHMMLPGQNKPKKKAPGEENLGEYLFDAPTGGFVVAHRGRWGREAVAGGRHGRM